jgi:hypothetical protein
MSSLNVPDTVDSASARMDRIEIEEQEAEAREEIARGHYWAAQTLHRLFLRLGAVHQPWAEVEEYVFSPDFVAARKSEVGSLLK